MDAKQSLKTVYLFTALVLQACSGGDITSGASGVCVPDYNVSGRWEGTLTSRLNGETRSFSVILRQNDYFVGGAIAVPSCWPFRDDLFGTAGTEECHSQNHVSVSSGLLDFDVVDLEGSGLFTLDWEPTDESTAMGTYQMFSEVSGCPKNDIGPFTMTRVN